GSPPWHHDRAIECLGDLEAPRHRARTSKVWADLGRVPDRPGQAGNISMTLADEAKTIKFLTRDRDTKFTASFDAVLTAEGTRIIKTSVRETPSANG
ncbi:MAG: hypothetical protein ACRDYY_10125, partial [Acidimicrobiales bacterium]